MFLFGNSLEFGGGFVVVFLLGEVFTMFLGLEDFAVYWVFGF